MGLHSENAALMNTNLGFTHWGGSFISGYPITGAPIQSSPGIELNSIQHYNSLVYYLPGSGEMTTWAFSTITEAVEMMSTSSWSMVGVQGSGNHYGLGHSPRFLDLTQLRAHSLITLTLTHSQIDNWKLLSMHFCRLFGNWLIVRKKKTLRERLFSSFECLREVSAGFWIQKRKNISHFLSKKSESN